MAKIGLAQPFLKWVGGKRQILEEIRKYVPKRFNIYYEPFVGGGAVLFDLQPQKAVINDVNCELINTYVVIRDAVDEVLRDLSKHQNEKEYFYTVRALDRTHMFKELTPVERASRLIFLNRTCYNGLFRVNSQGQFNVPFGDYKNPAIVNESVIRAVHQYLASNDVKILYGDFVDAVASATQGDFVYFDPPYDPLSDTASFTGYTLSGFSKTEQMRLRETMDCLTKRGCYVLLSNSATDFIKDLYSGYKMVIVEAARAINSNASKRGKIDELLVMNYGF